MIIKKSTETEGGEALSTKIKIEQEKTNEDTKIDPFVI